MKHLTTNNSISNMPIFTETIDASVEEVEVGIVDKDTLEYKLQEAKQYLIDTDIKLISDYVFKDEDDSLEIYIAKRAEAREFIRANKNDIK